MLSILLLQTALAGSTPLVVGGDVVLRESRDPIVGRLLLAPDGSPRVVVWSEAQGAREDLLLPGAQGWETRPYPAGVVVEGPADLLLLRDPALGEGGRLALERNRWVEAPGLGLPSGASALATLGPDGRALALGTVGAELVRFEEGTDGRWTYKPAPPEAHRAWAMVGALWWVDGGGLVGPRPVRRKSSAIVGNPTGGLDADGEPALALVERGRLVVQHHGGTASLALPRDVPVDPADCQRAPCVELNHAVQLAPGPGLAPLGPRLALPYVLTTLSRQVRCATNERGELDCEGPERRASELRLATVSGTKVDDQPLSDLLHLSEREISLWGVASDDAGALHLLFDAVTAEGRHALRYARLDPGPGRAPPPSGQAADPPAVLDTLTERSLGLAGFRAHTRPGPDARPPTFAGGEALSGGEGGTAWWSAPLRADRARPVSLEARFDVEPGATCGLPELRLVRDGLTLRALVTAQGLAVSVRPGETAPQILELRGSEQRIRLELAPGRATVMVDGGGLLRLDLPSTPDPGDPGVALFGTQESCPAGGAARVRWQGIRLE